MRSAAVKRLEQAAGTRQSLVEKAKELFAGSGYAATTVRSISSALDMADGILYHHFPGGKREILSVVLKEGFEKLKSTMGCHNDEIEEMPLFDALDTFYCLGNEFFTSDPSLLRIIFKEADSLGLDEARYLSAAVHERLEWFAGFLSRRHLRGEIRMMDFDAAAQQFLSVIIANVMGRLLNTDIVVRLDDREERHRLIRQTVALWT